MGIHFCIPQGPTVVPALGRRRWMFVLASGTDCLTFVLCLHGVIRIGKQTLRYRGEIYNVPEPALRTSIAESILNNFKFHKAHKY